MCMCVSISASVSLGCLFSPKVYIVIFQPYKNVRQGSGPVKVKGERVVEGRGEQVGREEGRRGRGWGVRGWWKEESKGTGKG